jgi:hypothetical protein
MTPGIGTARMRKTDPKATRKGLARQHAFVAGVIYHLRNDCCERFTRRQIGDLVDTAINHLTERRVPTGKALSSLSRAEAIDSTLEAFRNIGVLGNPKTDRWTMELGILQATEAVMGEHLTEHECDTLEEVMGRLLA